MTINFKNKKIGILGLGEENIALLGYLRNLGAKITICDKKSRVELEPSLKRLNNVKYDLKLGATYIDGLSDFDIVFRSPGLPYLNKKIQAAKEAGVEISSEIKLFFDLCPAPIIGVTGTKGKGTTTTLIGDILKKSVRSQDTQKFINRVYVAGNIGQAPIEFVDNLEKNDVVVLELSSFMLQDLHVSPHIAVVLDIKIDHLDHHENEAEYIQAKTAIVKYQTKNDFAVVNADYLNTLDFATKTPAEVYWFSRRRDVDQGVYLRGGELILRDNGKDNLLVKTSEVTLRGQHNLENIAAAATAAYLAGADLDSIKKVVKRFKGLEHRLEFVGQHAGIKYYNDSFSTTPDTAIAAVSAFTDPIILIAGGSEKNADYTDLGQAILKSAVKTAILIGDTGPRIKAKIGRSKIKIIDNCKNIEDAVRAARSETKKGDVILLSPASASFDWFENYKQRGKKFKEEVLKGFV